MSYTSTVNADNPQCYLLLNESSGTVAADSASTRASGSAPADSSGNSHTGSYSNSGNGVYIKTTSPVPDGFLMQIDGANGFISLPTTGMQTGNGAWTMECLFDPATTGSTDTVMGFGNPGSGGQAPRMQWDGTNISMDPWGGGVGGTAVSKGTVHHVVVTWDGTNVKIYIDGSLKTTTAHGALSVSLSSAAIGGRPGSSTTDNCPGFVGECAWYNVALTATQVTNHNSAITATGSGSYANTVLGDSPVTYLRLADKGLLDTGTYSAGGVTYSVTGMLASDPDTCVTLNGTSGYLYTALNFTNPGPFSEEIWFKSTTTNGGVLCEFSSSQTSPSSASRDRMIWMDNNGKLHAQVQSGGTQDVISSSAYNDGARHHAVITCGPTNGLCLYVDATLVGHNAAITGGQGGYTAYFIVGQGGPTAASGGTFNSNFIAATVEKPALYAYELSAAQVTNHYNVGTITYVTLSATFQGDAGVTTAEQIRQSATLQGDAALTATPQIRQSATLQGDAALTATPRISMPATLQGDAALTASPMLIRMAATFQGDASLVGTLTPPPGSNTGPALPYRPHHHTTVTQY